MASRNPLVIVFLLALSSTAVVLAQAHEYKRDTIEVVHPFFRATPPGALTGAGYMVIVNNGAEPDRLIGIEAEVAGGVSFHQTVTVNDIAKMIEIEGGIEISAGGEYWLGSNGTHAMLEGLTVPISLGQLVAGTLIFEKAGRVAVQFEVERAGTTLEQAMEAHAR